jgi:ComF family protein
MLNLCKSAVLDLLHLFYPHTCAGCGEQLPQKDQSVCLSCFLALPETNFQHINDNAVERIFYGRLKIRAAMAGYFFSKNSPLQHIIHAFKYENHREACIQMGIWLGELIQKSKRLNEIDLLIPMPLHRSREKKRGYNQAALLCEGIHRVTGILYDTEAVLRLKSTETQTRKSRTARWQNVQSGFVINYASAIENKNILLVDDVITTGATLEACGEIILKAKPASLSIAALAWASE